MGGLGTEAGAEGRAFGEEETGREGEGGGRTGALQWGSLRGRRDGAWSELDEVDFENGGGKPAEGDGGWGLERAPHTNGAVDLVGKERCQGDIRAHSRRKSQADDVRCRIGPLGGDCLEDLWKQASASAMN